MRLYSHDLPDLPKVTKELINTGDFRLYKLDDQYLLAMERTGDYFIVNSNGKVISSIEHNNKPRMRLADAIFFIDLPSAPSLNELSSASL